MSKPISRRDFIKLQLLGGAALATNGLGCWKGSGHKDGSRVIALGLDGLDPKLLTKMMQAGKLPTFSKLAGQGHFGTLKTSNPPQSPVAWSNFITGCDPSYHGIYDFVHRNPKNYQPVFSATKTEPSSLSFSLGDYVVPLSSEKTTNLRQGKAFWDHLEEHDIPATVFKIPANFPPTPTNQTTISGMGTPDILGTYGIYTYITDQASEIKSDLGGGQVQQVSFNKHRVVTHLRGPKNPFKSGRPKTSAEISIFRDPLHHTAKISLQGREMILAEKEWSPWVQVSFDLIPTVTVTAICRFYLKQVHPYFKLYVTPLHIDPSGSNESICTPADYAAQLYKKFGYFHTKGLPADTKALEHDVLDDKEFLDLDETYLEEKLAIYDYELSRFDSGLLFYYISNTDQRAHMFWRHLDPLHPAHDPKLAKDFGNSIEKTYQRMDELLARTLSRIDKQTSLLVFSDHGFCPFYKSFHLNSWLRDMGYLKIRDDSDEEVITLASVDWSKTKAYALGINGLYINLAGRESQGLVSAQDKKGLVDEIANRLEKIRDIQNGQSPIKRAEKSYAIFSGPQKQNAPDIIVGYNTGYRGSWQTVLGKIPDQWYEINNKKWSGDHCVAADLVPGSLLCNRALNRIENVSLCDLNATILDMLGVKLPPNEIQGRSVL
jgi:predicted AlkP superfamily phosphohydrolase/phosphomutase